MKAGHLQRKLGLFALTLCGISIIIGAGVYVLIGVVVGIAGKAAWFSFLVASILAGCTGLSYAELSSRFPDDSAEAHYTRAAFGRPLGMLVGLLMIITGAVASATVSLGFGGYLSSITGLTTFEAALFLLSLVCLITLWGIRQSTGLANFLAVIQVLGLIFIIAIGLPSFDASQLTSLSWQTLPSVLSGAALIFFAYLGFESIVKLSEEAKGPRHVIPLAIILAIITTTILYILVALAAVSAVGVETLSQSPAPLAAVADKVLGANGSLLITIFALAATASTVLMIFIATSRLIYGLANDSHDLPLTLGWVHPRLATPVPAILLTALLAWPFLLVGKIALVAALTDFTVFVVFLLINLTTIILHFRTPLSRESHIFQVPLNLGRLPLPSLIGAIFCLTLLFFLEHTVLIAGTFLLAVGLSLSYLRHFRSH